MLFGVLSLGKTDALDGECIETRFIIVGLPLVPVESRYCTWQSGFRSEGFPIRFQWKSAFFAYLRWWSVLVPLAALLDVLLFGFDASIALKWRTAHWASALATIGLWVFVCFFTAGPNARAKKQRRVLGYVTGARVWPEVQKPDTLARFASQLDAEWRRRGLSEWRTLPPVEGDSLLLLYALLRYAHVLEPAGGWHAARDALWQSIELDWARVESATVRAATHAGRC